MVSKQIRVFGKVQGVFFRASTKEHADKLGLKGWVRNELDGSVMIEVLGDEDKVQNLVKWCHKGPKMARVSRVEILAISIEAGYTSFSITT